MHIFPACFLCISLQPISITLLNSLHISLCLYNFSLQLQLIFMPFSRSLKGKYIDGREGEGDQEGEVDVEEYAVEGLKGV